MGNGALGMGQLIILPLPPLPPMLLCSSAPLPLCLPIPQLLPRFGLQLHGQLNRIP